MSTEALISRASAGVLTLTLNRPRALNALDPALASALADALGRARADASVRAVVLTGRGAGFCSGGDMKAAHRHIATGGAPADYFRRLTDALNAAVVHIRRMEKPVLAAVNGAASGAGLSLAAAADLRLAAASARFKPAFASIGMVPGGGWSITVPRMLGAAKAFELLFSSRILSADEARALGLVGEVVADDVLEERALERARALAAGPAGALGGAKALVNAALFADLEDQLAREQERILAQASTPEFAEALAAFVEKRAPAFGGDG